MSFNLFKVNIFVIKKSRRKKTSTRISWSKLNKYAKDTESASDERISLIHISEKTIKTTNNNGEVPRQPSLQNLAVAPDRYIGAKK